MIHSGWWWMVAMNLAFSQKYWECHHPNWRTHIFQRGGPTSIYIKFQGFVWGKLIAVLLLHKSWSQMMALAQRLAGLESYRRGPKNMIPNSEANIFLGPRTPNSWDVYQMMACYNDAKPWPWPSLRSYSRSARRWTARGLSGHPDGKIWGPWGYPFIAGWFLRIYNGQCHLQMVI